MSLADGSKANPDGRDRNRLMRCPPLVCSALAIGAVVCFGSNGHARERPVFCDPPTVTVVARGQIIGDSSGMLKLVFHRESRELLGVHIVGDGAVELVHIGQAVLSMKGTIDYFVNTVFNYPTLAECYKTAALDGINRLSA